MSEFTKTMYVIWPDYDYIDKAIEAGIDTLLVLTYHNVTEEDIDNLFQRYNGKVTLIPTVDWIQEGTKISQDQQFYDGVKYQKYTPCPLSIDYMKDKLKFSLELFNKYSSCTGIAIDFESYGKGHDGVVSYYDEWQDEAICKCDKCKGLSEHDQRMKNVELMQEILGEISIHQLPCVNPYLWSICDWWYNESTYKGGWNVYRILKYTFNMKWFHDVTTLNTSGVWMEHFTAKDYLKLIKKYIKSASNDGYWLYPQMRMSKNCYWRTHPDDPWSKRELAGLPYQSFIDAPNYVTSDPNFFNKLKELNDRIERYRNGFWFKFKKWFIGFFR